MIAAARARLAAVLDAARTLDRPLVSIVAALMAAGLVLSLAASPTAAARYDTDGFHFALRHGLFAAFGALLAFATASLPSLWVRRGAALLLPLAFLLVAVATFTSRDVQGAARWIHIGSAQFQPSEFLKPVLVVVWAWMLSEHMKRPAFPGHWIAASLYALAAVLLIGQRDVGQTALLGMTLAALMLLAGVSWRWIVGGGVSAAIAAGLLYRFVPYVRDRFDAWFLQDPEPGSQVARALDAIAAGGLFGRGPGEGVVKLRLPDAHSDFIFAVAAEEFGLMASIGLIALFAALVWRGLSRASRLIDPFAQLAGAGLIVLLALQAAIHIAVNMSLAPAKGMTLPFVSYGGSSMLGACLTIGFALALLRRAPGAYLYESRLRTA